jgi:hypothetical protein
VVVEVGTDLVLMINFEVVVALLLGVDISGPGILIGRCFGIALLALGLACWPVREYAESGAVAFRAMLTYNVLIALYLAYLGAVEHVGGCCCGRLLCCTCLIQTRKVRPARLGRKHGLSGRCEAVARRKRSVWQKMDENQAAVFRTYGNSF